MPNSREFDHFVSNRFKVEIEGVTVGAFAAVSGLESKTDVIEFVDGSDAMFRKRPGRTRYSNIVLKRGVTLGNSELWNWYKNLIDGKVERRSGSIIALGDDNRTEKLRYNFFEGWPCRWKSLELDGRSQETLIEEMEIAVEKIERG